MIRNNSSVRFIAIFLLVNFITPIFWPTVSMALTSGPNSPEFSSFEPVATTDMVNIFSGDFVYNLPVVNIPGPNGSGYALSLSYHSGVSSEEEASWVGFGWTLNPGAINRGKVGYPDDFDGVDVKKYNKTRPNWTASATVDGSLEYYSTDKKSKESTPESGDSTLVRNGNFSAGISASKTVRFNNYMGFAKTTGYGVNIKGIGFNMSRTGDDFTFSSNIVSALILQSWKEKADGNKKKDALLQVDYKKKKNKQSSNIQDKSQKETKTSSTLKFNKRQTIAHAASAYAASLTDVNSYPVSLIPYRGVSYNSSLSGELNVYVPVGIEAGYTRSFNIQENPPEMDMNAYGYMNNPDISMYEDNMNTDPYEYSKTLADYYVEKNNPYTKLDYYLGIPHNGADNFMLSGEGLSGGFRLFHKKIGHYYPNYTKSKQNIKQISVEVGGGPGNFEIGTDLGMGWQRSELGDWKNPNGVIDVCSLLEGIDFLTSDIQSVLNIISQITGSAPNIDGMSLPIQIAYLQNVINELKSDYACGNQFDYNDKGFFRFNNDLGGSINYTNSDDIASAKIPMNITTLIPGLRSYSPHMSPLGLNEISDKSGRSSYIDYKFNNATEYFEKSSNNSALLADYSAPDKAIREFEIYNESGMRYIYGLPVYTKSEKSLTTSIDKNVDDVDNKYLAFKSSPFYAGSDILRNKTIMGQSIDEAYAVNHLLTQITTPEYIDVTNNGPTDDDFGGWTKFSYRKWKSGDDNQWYHFRTPYYGLSYNANQLSDKKDDMGAVSSGDKQMYYVKAIETKTHVAFFVTNKTTASDFTGWNNGNAIPGVTGSGTDRFDGCGAVREDTDRDPAACSKVIDETQKPEKLEKIVIFSKNRLDKPLQTVYFQYDYSLCKKLPNNIKTNSSSQQDIEQSGKLTLKKVWFESEGIVKNKTAPYEFEYSYPAPYPTNIETRYSGINDIPVALAGDATQNPDYKPYALDMWGNYQLNGEQRHENLNPWVFQGDYASTEHFDPAAWNLKKIILPSGGEIHMQYEQKDYSYVQDQPAMAMVSLLPLPGTNDSYDYDETKYYLNLADIGLDAANPNDQTAINNLKALLEKYFVPPSEKEISNYIYFKYLYSLNGNTTPTLADCKAEYLSGYVAVNEVGVENNQIYLKLGNKKGKKNVPRSVCYHYYATNADGKLEDNDCNCKLEDFESFEEDISDYVDEEIEDNADYIASNNDNTLGKFRWNVARPIINKVTKRVFDAIPKKEDVCKYLNYNLSYLRIPIYVKAKLGGGIRIKRLLMYDNGIDSGDENVYGTEYFYEKEDGTSSGVATNEPAAGREENVLVGMLDRKNQMWISKIIAGEDRTQIEGPLGEDLLPPPSIGYSRVVVQNIHAGKTGTGYQVYDYYTAKDYPFISENTAIKDNRRRDWMNISVFQGLFNYSVDKYWLAQGYKFSINSFHGAQEKVSSYYGNYKDPGHGILSSYTEYHYYHPEDGAGIPMIRYSPDTKAFTYSYESPGREEDITIEMKSYSSRTMDISLELDVSLSWPAIAVSLSFMPSFSYQENNLSTHVTTKVLKYPLILKGTTTYINGWTSTSENIAFNHDNGKPVVTMTCDGYDKVKVTDVEHNGKIYNWDFPASWIYPELGQKDQDITNLNQLNTSAGSIVTYGTAGNWIANIVNGGFIWDTDESGAQPMEGVVSANAVQLDKNWFVSADDIIAEYNISTGVLPDLNKMYRSKANYVYKADIISSNNGGRIYNGGIYDGNFVMFDWLNNTVANQGKWMKLNETTKYSPDGNALEEKNILNIYSAVRFGYNNLLPVVTAQNATYNSIMYDDFENNSVANSTIAHSGTKSVNLHINNDYKFIDADRDNIQLTSQMMQKGCVIKLWLSSFSSGNSTFINTTGNLKGIVNNVLEVPFNKIASSGQWTLYEAVITNWQGLQQGAGLDVTLAYNFHNNEEVYIDDFRLQPKDAQASCNVYDVASFRLLTQFDDQHFGMFYQYNAEGKLVRKLVETEKGIKTIQETQYNVPLKTLLP